MQPSPEPKLPGLRRSLIFWAGLFVLGSIMWGWLDSCRAMSLASWENLWVCNFASSVSVTRIPWNSPDLDGQRNKMLPPQENTIFPSVRMVSGNEFLKPQPWRAHEDFQNNQIFELREAGGGDTFLIILPHWVIFSSALALWLCALLIRHMRVRHRCIQRLEEPVAENRQFT